MNRVLMAMKLFGSEKKRMEKDPILFWVSQEPREFLEKVGESSRERKREPFESFETRHFSWLELDSRWMWYGFYMSDVCRRERDGL